MPCVLSPCTNPCTTLPSTNDPPPPLETPQSPIMVELCRPPWLHQQLIHGKAVLILDCRVAEEFNVSHVRGAIHVVIPQLMLRRLKKGNLSIASVIGCNEGKERFRAQCHKLPVVCYDACTTLEQESCSIARLVQRRLAEEGCTSCVLEGGFSRFREEFPEHCESPLPPDDNDPHRTGTGTTILGLRQLSIHDEDSDPEISPNSTNPFPVQVLPYLYLGNASNAADLECLSKNRIQYILNVTPNVPNTFVNDASFKYMNIPINDHWSQNLAMYFPGAIQFIDEARENKTGVLVHCLAGISRSVTVTVAYLMHHSQLSLNDAYDFVKRCKPNISPNFNFMGQLLDLERRLKAERGECDCECGAGNPVEGEEGDQQQRTCTCRDVAHTKAYFSSPSVTSSSSSSVTSTTSSGTEFDYEVPPTPS